MPLITVRKLFVDLVQIFLFHSHALAYISEGMCSCFIHAFNKLEPQPFLWCVAGRVKRELWYRRDRW